jgi:DNA replication protein DnaC
VRERIQQYLRELKVSLPDDELDKILAASEQTQTSYLEFLERVLSGPANQRRENGIARRIRQAGFRNDYTLENFNWKFNAASIDRAQIEQLATGDFVRRGDNLVFVGQSGLGKSHLVQAIGRSCCVHGYRARYRTSAELLSKLGQSLADGSTPKLVRQYSRYDLLLIDEFGFDKLEREDFPHASSLLYKVIDSRTERSTALVTNIDFDAWGDYLGDPPLAMAFLDRVVDGAQIVKFRGQSYRAHRAQKPAGDK